MMELKRWYVLTGLSVLLLISLACDLSIGGSSSSSSAEETLQAIYAKETVDAMLAAEEPESEAAEEEPAPTATIEITHTTIPKEPGWVSQWWRDTDSSGTASQKRANGGDFLNVNLLERAFSANEMVYRPDLDIVKVEISQGTNFYYFMLHFNGKNPTSNTLSGWYGVEVDLNRDGRGDVLLWVRGDGNTQWNIDDVYVYKDNNGDVGGANPMGSNAPNYTGDSYETVVFSLNHLSDPDAAWKRVDPADSNSIQLAIKKSLLNNSSVFMWNGWADDGVQDPTNFDYNDFFTLAQAGSPISGTADYPLKELYLVDNTCRLPFGFDPTGNEPGVCYVPEPTATPKPTDVPPPCDCDSFENYTFIEDKACCEYCGYNWGGTQEFPCYK